MQNVLIIGGGLSGLAAAYELEQRGLPYTLIEVKSRLGGSILSEAYEGCVIDGGSFALHKTRDWPWMAALGLEDSLFDLPQIETGRPLVAFKRGTQTLVDTLVAQLRQGRILSRMAVSTLGKVDGQFTVCLENGMVMQFAALIIAAPARYVERMFYSFVPEISERLLRFHYDSITRVALVYRDDEITVPVAEPPDMGFAFSHWTASEHRVPPGHVLLQVGLRWPLDRSTPEALIAHLQSDMDWPTSPRVAQAHYWPESHCINPHHDDHAQIVAEIERFVPEGIALVGSDYRGLRLEDRVDQGRAAAAQIAGWLQR